MSDAIFPSGAHMPPPNPKVNPDKVSQEQGALRNAPVSDFNVNMLPVVAVQFHDGAALVRGVSFDIEGWLVVHFNDGVINVYPANAVHFIQFTEADEDTDAPDDVPEDMEDGPDPEWLEGDLNCPSCDAIMTPVKQAHTRAVCGSCGYRDPR